MTHAQLLHVRSSGISSAAGRPEPAVAAAAVEQLALQTTDVPASGTLRGDLHALLTSAVTVFTNGHAPSCRG